MSEYERETPRTPRTTRPEILGLYRPRASEVAEFLALEHPREHVAWLIRQHTESRPAAAPKPTSRTTKPPARPALTPLDLQE